jgi:hypothetical protein
VIAKNCAASQKLVKSIAAQDKNNTNKRQTVYTNVSTRLSQVIGSLSKQGIDSTELKTIQAQFNDSANQYLTDAATYKTAMEDLSTMDCAADPAGFEATLASARQLRLKLAGEAGQIASAKSALVKALAKTANVLSAGSGQGGGR